MKEQNFTKESQNTGYELTSCMALSDVAKRDLMEVLRKEFGPERAKKYSDEDLNKVGLLLLNILAESLKMKVVN